MCPLASINANNLKEPRYFLPEMLSGQKSPAIPLTEDNGPRQGGNNEAPPHTYRMFSHHNFYEQ